MSGDALRVTPLSERQAQFLRALSCERHADAVAILGSTAAVNFDARSQWTRGLMAYRSNGLALAQRALHDAYPVVARLVGAETFEHLARTCRHVHPPLRGDIAQWGADLARVIESVDELNRAEPYLADVARVEWHLHLAASAADANARPESFERLASEDPARVRLSLSPATATVESAYPVVTILLAHRADDPDLSLAAARMQSGIGETALVWREGFVPRVREAVTGEAAFIAALKENRSLADSLAVAEGFDFGAWLVPAVQEGLLLAVVAHEA